MVKFQKYYVAANGLKARVSYSAFTMKDGRKCVTLYAKDYGHALGKILPETYENGTDMMTDYFEKGRARVFEDSPYYAAALARAEA